MPWKVIEFQDNTGQIMVARVPPDGTGELVTGSQLIVQDGQVATFFHDGKPADSFRVGRYSLSTQNVPVLSKLLNVAMLSLSPFRSYVYFVALKTFTDLGWGTSSPILFRDSELKVVNLRAHGTFAVRIGNPKVFLHTLVGTQGMETTDAVEQYLRKAIVSRFTQILPDVMTTVIDLPQRYEELSVRVKQAVRDHFSQYGLELVDLIIEAVTVPPEVQDAINRAAGTRAVSANEVSHYERVMRSDALRDAAQQPGGDVGSSLAAGLGIAAGLDVARIAVQSTPATTPSQRPSLEEVRSKLQDLKGLVDDGLITQEDFESQKKRLLDSL
jgi:membrane protease subunit (stomatin/prohibitin family)